MSKKAKRGKTDVYSSYTIDDNKARIKYDILLQDYNDLLEEIEAKKRNLQKVKQKNLRLSNEVRFLQKRYRKLMENPSQQNQCVLLKRQPLLIESHSSRNYVVQTETPSSSIEASLDLNQSSLQNEEYSEYYLMQGKNAKDVKYTKRYGNEEETSAVYRDLGGNHSSRAGKRKISWQDHALKV